MALTFETKPLFNQWGQYTGPIEVSFDCVADKKNGKLMDLEFQIKMADITLKRFWGTTLSDHSEKTLEPLRNHLFKIFDLHKNNFKEQADTIGNEEKGLRAVFQDQETMANNTSGKPKNNEEILEMLALHAYRASAGAAQAFIPNEALPAPFLDEATPWTGCAIYPNKENIVIGLAVNDNSTEPQRSESRIFIRKDYEGKGRHQQAEIALMVQAWVFTALGLKLHSEEGKTTSKRSQRHYPVLQKQMKKFAALD